MDLIPFIFMVEKKEKKEENGETTISGYKEIYHAEREIGKETEKHNEEFPYLHICVMSTKRFSFHNVCRKKI
jgi:hypothetical protein